MCISRDVFQRSCIAYSAQFEDEFRARVRVSGYKISCLLEMDTADFTTSYILLDRAEFATGCTQIFELELKSGPRTEPYRIHVILRLAVKIRTSS